MLARYSYAIVYKGVAPAAARERPWPIVDRQISFSRDMGIYGEMPATNLTTYPGTPVLLDNDEGY